jgi:hypothetical protein
VGGARQLCRSFNLALNFLRLRKFLAAAHGRQHAEVGLNKFTPKHIVELHLMPSATDMTTLIIVSKNFSKMSCNRIAPPHLRNERSDVDGTFQ